MLTVVVKTTNIHTSSIKAYLTKAATAAAYNSNTCLHYLFLFFLFQTPADAISTHVVAVACVGCLSRLKHNPASYFCFMLEMK